MKDRAGYTLIELIATMTITVAVVTLLGLWLNAVMQNQGAAGEHLQAINGQERLARQFREDVHAAREVLPLLPASPEVRFRLDRGDFEVHYLAQNKLVERIEEFEGNIRRRELYQVPALAVQFEADPAPTPGSLVRLTVQNPKGASMAPDLYIDAVLGSDRRFERSSP
jgi:hypothetical protein